ncbi:multidrug effflux MFS transporter [Sphaerotilus sp.]|uniref:multidrug effflux MFS transporter n=1 Tax=Sphaerotilus sp. TaxID=2093942 RepID=UPI0025D5ABBE|nr:multidrug effflux MFS transporter [Sphaerotilus sp.]
MLSSLLRHALVLGLVSAIGPFAIDMYLPALPEIGHSLQADTAQVQRSLTVFFLALGVCQLLYGPLSDRFGRKPPLYFGLALFVAGSIGCALAPDIQTLIVLRFIAGVGACACTVIPRAVVRDLHTGVEATRLTSLLMLVFSVSPILAPLAGSLVIAVASWRWIFWTVSALGVLGIALLAWQLEESRPTSARTASTLGGVLATYWTLLRDRHFMALTLIGAFGMSAFFAYLGNSSFLLIGHYGVTPMQYGFLFSINAAAFIGTAQFNSRLCVRYGLVRVVQVGVAGFASIALGLWALFAFGVDRLDLLSVLVFCSFGWLGLVVPTTAVLALETHGEIAGTASALLGTTQMVIGAVVMGVLSLFIDGTPMPMVSGIGGCALVTGLLTWFTLEQESRHV